MATESVTESAAAAAWSPCIISSLHATSDDLLRQRRVIRKQPLPKHTAPSQETNQQMPPQRSPGSSRGVRPQTSSDNVPRQTSSRRPDTRDAFRRRTWESPLTSADLNNGLPSPEPIRSFPAVTHETHRRLMSEVEAGTANSAGRFYAEIVKRHEKHARRSGGICPSPPRCPGTPLMIDG